MDDELQGGDGEGLEGSEGEEHGGDETPKAAGAAKRGRLVMAAVPLGVVFLLAVGVLMDGQGNQGPGRQAAAPAALAREVMDSARGGLVVRQLRRAYVEEVELYGAPTARSLAALRDDFVLECAVSADASLERGVAAGFDPVEAMEATTQYCEETARIAFDRAGIPMP